VSELLLDGLSKRFGALAVFDDIDLAIERGERRAIIGPNGAGKTTLFGLISGFIQPTRGRVVLFGEDVTAEAPDRRARRGLGRTFQITDLFSELSAVENLVLGLAAHQRLGLSMLRPVRSYDNLYDRAYEMLAMWGLDDKSESTVRELGYGEQRQVEMLLALTTEPRLLLLDEPTAGLSPAETQAVTDLVSELPGDLTVVLIEHDMDVAFELATQVTVLHAGAILAEGTPSQVRENDDVLQVYLGTDFNFGGS
jgi:branched-chain amino acid transport system ATP-binding protein